MIFSNFAPRHIPALFIAFTQTLGGLWPILGSTSAAMREFGLPACIADSHEAQTAFVAGAVRTTVIGAIIYTLYLQEKYADFDSVLLILGTIVGMVYGYVCVREG